MPPPVNSCKHCQRTPFPQSSAWCSKLLKHVENHDGQLLLRKRQMVAYSLPACVIFCSVGLRRPLGVDFRGRQYWVLGGAAGAWRVFVEEQEGALWVRVES